MIGRMPIPGGENRPSLSAEMFDVGVDSRNQIIVFWDSQCSTWEKIVLGVNEEKG